MSRVEKQRLRRKGGSRGGRGGRGARGGRREERIEEASGIAVHVSVQ